MCSELIPAEKSLISSSFSSSFLISSSSFGSTASLGKVVSELKFGTAMFALFCQLFMSMLLARSVVTVKSKLEEGGFWEGLDAELWFEPASFF